MKTYKYQREVLSEVLEKDKETLETLLQANVSEGKIVIDLPL